MKAAVTTIATSIIAGLALWYLTTIYFADRSPAPVMPPVAAIYDQLLTAVVPPASGGNPLSDVRVQAALRNYLAPTGTGAADTQRLLAEAGYPDGISVMVSRAQFPGAPTVLSDIVGRLADVGVRLEIR